MSPLGKPSLDPTEMKALLKHLNLRIGVAAAIVATMLWALTAALEAWGEGRLERLPWLLAFQVVAFAGAVATWIVRPRERVLRHSGQPIATPQPVRAE